MSELPTPRRYAGIHLVDAICVRCDRWSALDLEDLIRRGLGDVPLIRLPLRCAACGKTSTWASVRNFSYAVPGRIIGRC